jgi:UDP-3-O-[3-hydroxymyristoyl] glucosamine N-acyltransferase
LGTNASLGADAVLGRAVRAGDELDMWAGVSLGYAVATGNQLLAEENTVVGNLVQLGDRVRLGVL